MDPTAPRWTRVELARNGLHESVHLASVAVWRDGRYVARSGDPTRPAFLRSAAKLIQAFACIQTGAAARFAMTPAELAIACGSHGGEEFHVRTAAGLLEKIGLSEADLLCGAHPPGFAPAARRLAADGREPGALHNNCSGKHSAMLAACRAANWETRNYIDPAHPLQILNRRNLATLAGIDARSIRHAIDGCSVPTFHVPPEATARAFARLASPDASEGLTEGQRIAARRVLDALRLHPEMIGGTDRIDTDLIRTTNGRIVSKVGAEGMWCAAVRDARFGLAVQCEDGASRASYAVGMAVLRDQGMLSDEEWASLAIHHDPVRRNHRQLDVGRLRVEPPQGAFELPQEESP